ncbi:MAG: DUF99 family protein [Desulfobacterales bacterium]|jgi:endonuclease V-like protein UPF0215 family
MRKQRFANVIGFDDAPFPRTHRGSVKVVGAVFANHRLDGVLVGAIEKDGCDASEKLAALVKTSKFYQHARLIMLQGITMGGFNVVDVFDLHRRLDLPILVVARYAPDMVAIRRALERHLKDGQAKWTLIESLGDMEPAGNIYVQRVGLTPAQATEILAHWSIHSRIPEPLRCAHLIAGALVTGQSRNRP